MLPTRLIANITIVYQMYSSVGCVRFCSQHQKQNGSRKIYPRETEIYPSTLTFFQCFDFEHTNHNTKKTCHIKIKNKIKHDSVQTT